jgi:thioredoxin-dependent adenylylsulfate APS reductase
MSSPVTTDLVLGAPAEEVLRWAYETFPKVAIVASFQAESSVLIDLASHIKGESRLSVITLDTGRLPQATHALIDRVRDRYSIDIDVVSPDAADLHDMVGRHGVNLFYTSADLRRHCCEVRKSRPLARALKGYDAWITGVRREQAATRAETPVVAADPEHEGLTKIAPLAAWSKEQVWAYIRENDLPYNSLYTRGYTSIGCEPCTRPTTAGEDERAGRWWWEVDEVKECGLNWSPNGALRAPGVRSQVKGQNT